MTQEQTDIIEFLDDYKRVPHALCGFLLKIRKKTAGVTTPLRVPMSRLSQLFPSIHDKKSDKEKIELIEDRILFLCQETVYTKGEHRLLKVRNPEIFESFFESYKNNDTLRVVCSSQDLEEYQRDLENRMGVMRRANEGVRIEPTASGGVKIFLGEKSMEIKPGRNGVNVRSALVQLMFGESVGIGNDAISVSSYAKYEDYEKGDVVECDDLQNMMLRISGLDEHPRDSPKIKVRAVSDAARDLNEIVSTELGKPIFEYNPSDGTLEWVL